MKLSEHYIDKRFIRIKEDKKALETAWQKGANYSFDDIQKFKDKAFGMIIGPDNIVIDFDNAMIGEEWLDKLPKTRTIKTPHGYHFIYKCTGMKYKELRLFGLHMGEIRTGKLYIIVEGSNVKDKQYMAINDLPIGEITATYVTEALKRFLDRKAKRVRPCFVKAYDNKIDMTGSDGHNFRNAFCCELRAVGATEYETVSMFVFQKDFNKDTATKYIEGWDVTGGHPWRCDTIIEQCSSFVDCDKCPFNKKHSDKEDEPQEGIKLVVAELTDDERKCLEDKDLLLNILEEYRKEGIVGMEESMIALTVKTMLRLVINAKGTSSNISVSDTPGAGKDWVTEQAMKVLLEGSPFYINMKGTSPTVFNYLKPRVGNCWTGHVIRIEDPPEDLLNSENFKKMSSNGTGCNDIAEVIITKDQDIHKNTLRGKPVFIITSATQSVNQEGDRRWDAMRIDVSRKLTQSIEINQGKIQEGIIEYQPDKTLRSALQKLQAKTVIIPYASVIAEHLPDDVSMRTLQFRIYDYIKASAVMHQYQRKTDDKGRVLADGFDFFVGFYVFNLLNSLRGVYLNKFEEELLDIIRKGKTLAVGEQEKLDEQERAKKSEWFDTSIHTGMTVQDIVEAYNKSQSWVYETLTKLEDKGLLEVTHEYEDEYHKKVKHYTCRLGNSFLDWRPMIAIPVVQNGPKRAKNEIQQRAEIIKVAIPVFQKCIYDIEEKRLSNGITTDIYIYIFTESPHVFSKKNAIPATLEAPKITPVEAFPVPSGNTDNSKKASRRTSHHSITFESKNDKTKRVENAVLKVNSSEHLEQAGKGDIIHEILRLGCEQTAERLNEEEIPVLMRILKYWREHTKVGAGAQ